MVVAVLQRRLLALEDVVAARRREDRGDGRLADLAPSPRSVTGNQPREGPDPRRGDDLEQLGPALLEVLAQRSGQLHAGVDEQLLDGRQAATARRARGGAALERREVAGALGDRRADRPLGHVVAGADDGVVREGVGPQLGRGGRDEARRVPRHRASDEGLERRVRRGVTDEDTPEEGPGIVGQDDLRVGSLRRVGVHDLQRAGCRAHGVPERGDVDAEQLELGGQVGAGEGGRTAEEPVRDDLGHRVARRDQAVAGAVDGGHLADGPDVLGGCPAGVVGDQAAAFADRQAGGPAEGIGGPDPGREDDEVGEQRSAVGQLDREPSVVLPVDRPGSRAGVDLDPETRDEPLEDDTATRVDLERHEPGRELDDVRCQTEAAQRVGGLEPEQSAPDDQAVRCPLLGVGAGERRLGCRPDPVEVLERAVDEAALGVVARHRRDERSGAGRHHQLVVPHDRTGLCGDGPCGAVEPRRPRPEPQLDEVVSGIRVVGQGERAAVPAPHVGGQADAVVCR